MNAGLDGAKTITVKQGVFKWANKGADAVTQALVGLSCSIEDDQTVRATAAGSSTAGVVNEIDADGGIWVETFLG